jgi:hypothetical protein
MTQAERADAVMSRHLSEAERGDVRAELERILGHPSFRHSKRYPVFLRYVVERALEGHAQELKERTVGAEALGRPASYDTGQDPVVRTTAAEVRKRLALYYQQAGPPGSVRIDLPVGSYVPYFEFGPARLSGAGTAAVGRAQSIRRASVAVVAGVAVIVAAVFLLRAASSATALERFWQPILDHERPVLVVVGPAGRRDAAPSDEVVTLNAATTASRVVGLLQEHAKPFELKASATVEFADLRAQPIIAIGGFNNQWTMKITGGLRFGFERSGRRIVDRARPEHAGWKRRLDQSIPTPQVLEDFAMIARVRDTPSGQLVLVIGGLGSRGTEAAGEFLTVPGYLEEIARGAPAGWDLKNLQLVITTTVVDGVAGPPRVVASHFFD